MIVGGEMVERSKPEPDIFLKAAHLCGLKPEQAVVLEDSEMVCVRLLPPAYR